MGTDYGRIHRLLKILTLIQGQPGWTAAKLAKECRISTRQIYRDMKTLSGAGIPYFYDEEARCYRVQRSFFMKPVDLTLDESLALVALGERIGGGEQIPFMRAANRAVAKIRGQLPESIRRELEGFDPHVTIKLAQSGSSDGIGDVYEKVRQAMAVKQALHCRYESVASDAGRTEANGTFIFKPYTLFFSQRAWYAVGHHGRRNQIRCLKLNRFTQIDLTTQRYTVPRDFSLQKHLGLAWRMMRGDRRYAIEITFDPPFADTIADTHWHPTQQITWLEDGSIVFECEVDGLDEIVWWVLSMGPHAVVRKPRELAQRVTALAAEVVEAYGVGQANTHKPQTA